MTVKEMNTQVSDNYIISDPEIMGGTPCIRGTRLTVYAVAERLRGGETPTEIAEGYPDLSDEMIRSAVAYADEHPFKEHPEGRPWRKSKGGRAVA